jgi:hypothetical protein
MNTKRFLCAALGAVCYFAFLQAQVRTEQTLCRCVDLKSLCLQK